MRSLIPKNLPKIVFLLISLFVPMLSATSSLQSSVIPSHGLIYYPSLLRASYTVSTDGTTVEMKNYSTGQIIWRSPSASAILKACIGNLTNGGTIFLERGVYTLDVEFALGNNIHVSGEGRQSYLKIGTTRMPVIRINSKSNVLIENLGIEGYNDGTADGVSITGNCDNVIVRNCWITKARYGIQIYETALTDCNTLLEDNYLVDNVIGELYVANARNVTAQGNFCVNNVNASFGLVNAYCEKNLVHGNVVDGLKGFGIQIFSSNETTVSANIIRNIGGNAAYDQTGITVDGSKFNIITNNHVTNVAKHGIYLEDSIYCYIGDNMVTENQEHGIQLYYMCAYNLVCNNTVVSSGRTGIIVNSGNNNTVQRNLVLNNGQTLGGGILLYNSVTGTLIADNYVTDNQTLKTQDYGIKEMKECDYNYILRNYVAGNEAAAIIVIGTHTIVEDNIA